MANSARIAVRVNPAVKAEVEQAAVLSGSKSMSEFIIQATTEKAKQVLEDHQRIRLSNADFDKFIEACEHNTPSSSTLTSLARKVDAQGFK